MTETPSQEAIDEALHEIKELIEGIGDQTIGTIDQTEGGKNLTGWEAQHGMHGYAVVASPDMPYVKLQTGFDVAEVLAAANVQQSVAGQVPDVQLSEASIQSERSDLRDGMDDDEIGVIRAELADRLGTGEVATRLHADDRFVSGFTVYDRLYVYDREITVPDFYDEVHQLINVMWVGKEFLVDTFDLYDVMDNQSGPSVL